MFEQYREFRILATHLNFTRAAMELNEGESTLSKHIAELEREVGCRLVERSPVSLTAAGLVFLEGFSRIANDAAELFDRCRNAASIKKGAHLTIAQLSYRGSFSSVLNRALFRMTRELPGFTHSLESDRALTVAASIETGASDVGFSLVDEALRNPALSSELVCVQRFQVLACKDGPFAGRRISFEELASATVASSTNRKLWVLDDSVRRICGEYGFEPTFVVRDFDVVLDTVIDMRGNEVLFCTEELVEGLQVDNPELVVADVDARNPMTYPTFALWRADDENPAIPMLVNAMKTTFSHRQG